MNLKKNSLLVLLISLAASTSSFAEDSSSGCGLGWKVAPQTSLFSSSLRSTTNALLPNTFSMTSGTSGCAKHAIVKNMSAPLHFIESNWNAITLEGAQGDGEYLRSFAMVLGCDGNYPAFSQSIQSHYSTLFPSDATPAQLLMNIETLRCGATI